jgi:hypothetical protein
MCSDFKIRGFGPATVGGGSSRASTWGLVVLVLALGFGVALVLVVGVVVGRFVAIIGNVADYGRPVKGIASGVENILRA